MEYSEPAQEPALSPMSPLWEQFDDFDFQRIDFLSASSEPQTTAPVAPEPVIDPALPVMAPLEPVFDPIWPVMAPLEPEMVPISPPTAPQYSEPETASTSITSSYHETDAAVPMAELPLEVIEKNLWDCLNLHMCQP